MSEVNLIPDGNSGWGNGLSAAAGAFIGSWFGNGWGGGGYGYGRGGYGVGPVGVEIGANAVFDDLSNIQQSINGLGLTVVQGQGNSNLTACQGFNGINTAVLTSANQVNNVLAQGFAGINTAISNSGSDTRFAISNLGQQMQECCCNLRTAIASEGAATRELIQSNFITDLQTKLCDEKARSSQLASKLYLTESQQAQNEYLVSQLRTTTTTTTA